MVQMVVPNLMHMCVPKFLNYGATNTASPSYCLVWITVLLIENFESPLTSVIIPLPSKFTWYMLYMLHEAKWSTILHITEQIYFKVQIKCKAAYDFDI